jgi:tetratricopeptide (TPR) repeat protein
MYLIQGCGKTVTASFLVDHLGLENSVFHFFCRNTDPDKRLTSSILRTLLSQMLSSTAVINGPDAFEEVLSNVWTICETYPDVKVASVDTLWKVFEIVVARLSTPIFLVDALDECDTNGKDREFLVDKLLELTRGFPSVRVIVTSRDMRNLAALPYTAITEIRVQRTDVEEDILTVIKESVALSSKLSSIRDRVVTAVAEGSDGMFLWAKLMLANLETATNLRSVSAKLDRMPSGLSSMYMRILRDIADSLTEEERQLQQKLFSWIVTAFRPLRVSEITVALSITPGIPQLADEDLVLDIRADIKKLCGPLVYVMEDDSIQPIHLSVKEALCGDMDADSTGIWTNGTIECSKVDQKAFHLEVGAVCLTYLSFPILGDPSTQVGLVSKENFASSLAESLPFLGYAASSWHLHMIQTRPDDLSSLTAVRDFLESENCFAWLECYSLFAALAPGEFGHHFQVQSSLREWVEQSPTEPEDIKNTVDEYLLQAIRKGVNASQAEFGSDDLQYLFMLSRLGALYCFLDRHVEAKEIRLTVLKGYQRVLGATDLRTRRALTDLGYVMYMLDDFEQAEDLFYQALGGSDQSMWKRDALELETMKELATVYLLTKRFEEARAVMESALEGMMQLFTDRHRLTVLCRQYLASIYREQGENDKALETAMENRAISIEIQGEDHPDTLRGDLFIANLEHVAGKWDESREMLLSLWKRQKKVLGEQHADTLMTSACLGRLYALKGRTEDAEAVLRDALAGTERIFGVGHSQTNFVAIWLYNVLRDVGRGEEAERIAGVYTLELH